MPETATTPVEGLNPREQKVCGNPQCARVFDRPAGMRPTAFLKRVYCDDDCRITMRKRAQRALPRKPDAPAPGSTLRPNGLWRPTGWPDEPVIRGSRGKQPC